MSDLKSQVESWVRAAAISVLGERGDVDPLVRPAKDVKFGDYQANLALSLGKSVGKNPRELAGEILAALLSGEHAPKLQHADVAGGGFINLKLDPAFIVAELEALLDDARLGVAPRERPGSVVVDYSSPNLAKEMHIGHLRSTIIGDAIARVLEFAGDKVIRQNHLGDWGTQFGMLLEHLLDIGWNAEAEHSIRDLNELYKTAKQRFDSDVGFQERARLRVVALQSGDAQALKMWRLLIAESVRHMKQVYDRLNVALTDADIQPESAYNALLPGVVTDLRELGLLREDDGAQVVFPDGFLNKEGEPLPLIVQKRDGGFGYAATDLAGGRYRVRELGARRVIYVVDARQSDHFAMVFSVLRAANWAPANVSLEHIAFGSILGADKKPFKSREGDVVRLADVLDEAALRAKKAIENKATTLSPADVDKISRAVGIGAVKYADLSNERIKDYVFDWDRMLALEGNTAPYLQNAYVRIQAIFRKGAVDVAQVKHFRLELAHPEERKLGLQLLQFPSVIDSLVDNLELNRLCNYLYELASSYHSFYEHCSVLKADLPVQRDSRLALSSLVARTLQLGLALLGVATVDQM